MSASSESVPFEEVKRPVVDPIDVTEFYCAKVEKAQIGGVLKALGSLLPMTNDVVVVFGS